jgi:lipopolysaccharide assembly protein A
MQFLKILFWCLIAFLAAVFTIGNWISVPVRLPGGLVAETNLPLLLLATFLLGLLPAGLYHQVQRWRLRQRLTASERQIAEIRTLAAAPVPPPTPLVPDAPAPVVVPAPVPAPPEPLA